MKNRSTRYDDPIRIACLLAALLLAPAYLRAQSSWRPGLAMGYEFGAPLSIDRTPGAINTTPGFDGSGVSENHTVWLGGRGEWSELFGDGFGLTGILAVGMSRGSFTSNPYQNDLVTLTPTGDVIPDTSRFVLDITTGILRLDLRMTCDLGPLTLGGGAWLDYRVMESIRKTESSVSSSPIFTSDILPPSEQSASTPLRGGILASLSTTLFSVGAIEIRPELYGRLDLPALSDGLGLQAFAAGVGISMPFEPTKRESPPTQIATAPVHRTPPPPEASIDLYCTEPGRETRLESAVVSNRRILHDDHIALLPRLFFERDSAHIPARYDNRATSTAFTLDSLAGLSETEVNRHLLDVIGLRMRALPASRITLLGSVSSEEPMEIAAARATEVRNYLHEVWGIDVGRIRVGAGGSLPGFGRSDAARRAVTVTSQTPQLLAPLGTQWIAQELVVPTIGIDPQIVADKLSRWTITIRHGDVVAARYSNLDAENSQELDLAFLLDGERSDSTLQPLVAELTVEDSSGASTSARDTLPLRWDRSDATDDRTTTDRQQIRHLLLTAPDDPSGVVTSVRVIAESVRNGATVTIAAPTVTTQGGSQPTFSQGTTNFAEELLAAIREEGLEVSEFHLIPTDHSSPRDTPEEELLSAGTTVTVEQRLPEGGRTRP